MDESRRDLLKKGAIVTGAAWVAPVLISKPAFGNTGGSPAPGTSTTTTTIVSGCVLADTVLDSSQEVPPSSSQGGGLGVVTFDNSTLELCATLTFSTLTSNAISAHIHGPAPAGVNADIVFGFTGVPSATSGTIGPECFTLTEAQRGELCGGLYYFNIHSTNFPGGEIRGQIVPS